MGGRDPWEPGAYVPGEPMSATNPQNPWDAGAYVPGEAGPITTPTADYIGSRQARRDELFGKVSKGVNDVIPFASNILNQFQNLPTPKAPITQANITPELVNFNSDRAELDKQLRGLNAGISATSSNPGIGNAQRVGNLGKYLEAKGRLSQSEAQANAEIKNKTAMFNAGITGANVDRENQYRDLLLNRSVNQQRLRSENVANFGDKVQMARRDKDLMALEREKLAIIPRVYKDTGVADRNLMDLILEQQQRNTKKLGGRLSKYLKY